MRFRSMFVYSQTVRSRQSSATHLIRRFRSRLWPAVALSVHGSDCTIERLAFRSTKACIGSGSELTRSTTSCCGSRARLMARSATARDQTGGWFAAFVEIDRVERDTSDSSCSVFSDIHKKTLKSGIRRKVWIGLRNRIKALTKLRSRPRLLANYYVQQAQSIGRKATA